MFGSGGDGRDVVTMTGREKERRRAPVRVVEAYWHSLCSDDHVPLRSEVDPRGMESALEYAFLLERIAPSLGKVRVAGSHLSDLLGMQVAGMPLSTLIAPEDRDRFGQAVSRLFADPAVIRISLRAEGGFGKPDMEGDMILMPLRSDFGEVSRALGALVTDGRIGRAPRRFKIDSIDVESALVPGVTATPAAPAPSATQQPRTERRVPAAPFIPRKPRVLDNRAGTTSTEDRDSTPRQGHLRLVVCND